MPEIEITESQRMAGETMLRNARFVRKSDAETVADIFRAMLAAGPTYKDTWTPQEVASKPKLRTESELMSLARTAMDELHQMEICRMGAATSCCYDFGIPAVVKVLREVTEGGEGI